MPFRAVLALFLLSAVFAVVLPIVIAREVGDAPPADASQNTLDANNDERDRGGSAGSPAASTVQVRDDQVVPREVEITAGGRVLFANRTGTTQTLRFQTPGSPKPFPALEGRRTKEVTFLEPGTYRYRLGNGARGSVFVN